MGCPTQGILGKTLVFTVQSRDDTGAAVDLDANAFPTYKVYEDETGGEMDSGTMAKLDDTDTDGFYSEELDISAANDYDAYKHYTIRIEATVDGIALVCVYTFMVIGRAAITVSSGTGKTLANIKTMCKYRGWNDFTTDGVAELENFINGTLQILAMLAQWPEYYRRDGSATFSAADDAEELDETNLVRVGTVIRTDKAAPLDEMNIDDWLFNKKYHTATGPPNSYALRKYTTAGLNLTEMLLYPNPAVETTLYYTYQVEPVTLSADGEKTDWPLSRMWLLAKALDIRLAAIDRDTAGVALYGSDFMALVNRAYNQARPSYKPIVARPVVMSHKWRLGDIGKTIVDDSLGL